MIKTRFGRTAKFGRTTRVATTFAVAATALVATATGAHAVNPEQRAAAYARPAIVYLSVEFNAVVRVPLDWQVKNYEIPVKGTGSCTGFVVNEKGYIATAGHCVDPDPNEGPIGRALLVKAVNDSGLTKTEVARQGLTDSKDLIGDLSRAWKIEGVTAGSDPTPNVTALEVVAASNINVAKPMPARIIEYTSFSKGDVALIKVEQDKLPTVELAKAADITVGTSMLSIGYPGSIDNVTDATLEPTFKDGKVSSIRSREGGLPVIEVSAALSSGMSGGPMVDLEGRVIGVNSFKPGGESQAFNFASSVDLLQEMLRRNGLTAELGVADRLYRQGVDAYLSNDMTTAVAKLDQVLDLKPSHQQAQDLRVKAIEGGGRSAGAATSVPADGSSSASSTTAPTVDEEDPVLKEESSGTTPVIWLLVALVVALLAVTVTLLVRRRSTTGTAPAPGPAGAPAPDGAAWHNRPSPAGRHQDRIPTPARPTTAKPPTVSSSQPANGWYKNLDRRPQQQSQGKEDRS